MGEGFGTDVPGSHTLQSVVAYRCRRGQSLTDIGLIDDFALFGGVTPDPSQAIGLQFEFDGKGISLRWIALLQLTDLLLNPQ
jgi:hypothetical protein